MSCALSAILENLNPAGAPPLPSWRVPADITTWRLPDSTALPVKVSVPVPSLVNWLGPLSEITPANVEFELLLKLRKLPFIFSVPPAPDKVPNERDLGANEKAPPFMVRSRPPKPRPALSVPPLTVMSPLKLLPPNSDMERVEGPLNTNDPVPVTAPWKLPLAV